MSGFITPPPLPLPLYILGLTAVSTTKQFVLQPFSQGNGNFNGFIFTLHLCLFILSYQSFSYVCHPQAAAGKLFYKIIQKQEECHKNGAWGF